MARIFAYSNGNNEYHLMITHYLPDIMLGPYLCYLNYQVHLSSKCMIFLLSYNDSSYKACGPLFYLE